MEDIKIRGERSRFPARSVRWLDADYHPEGAEAARNGPDTPDWWRSAPFILLHVACFAALWTGASAFAVGFAVLMYVVRMFGVTAALHRYFSHRTYRTSRFFQFLLAVLAASCVQRGALWWAATHRHHHRHSDDEEDKHSPVTHGFWWSHIGWITSRRNFPTDYDGIRDFARFPELVFLNRFDTLVPALLALATWGLGALLEKYAPGLGVTGMQLLVWGFVISTVAVFHGTACINSLSHVFGTRRFGTHDHSRNNGFLAFLTLGEGWHNNHHRYPASVRQGFYWWEADPTWWMLRGFAALGLVWDLRPVPASIYEEARTTTDTSVRERISGDGE